MSAATPKQFDAELRSRLAQREEIRIETRRGGAEVPAHHTSIWVVVVDDNIYVRSAHGTASRWYQEIRANPAAAVHIGSQRIPVRAALVTDDATIARVSDEYRRKYRDSPFLPALVRDDISPMTLRLEPQ
jgi:hypothetical protein